ncbi:MULTISPECIES: DNA/RNA non-specific endonuclease [Croceitalea]|uniref:Endonuclease n=1 Tax=Croceitalea vernalis TaxID=3075599 RepID=A0ABU3BC17_9FLAO|nr:MULTISPECIES: DNA/RNA non-specific endonuclease [unclassified Croceitalea]MDT0538237.1 DNA/RNA non-specific endonuclease [Croceitalea sp. P059]MDT0620021.1 DNA/RNA non-specific endonuclease [Croceitalea sp. P007]
MKKDKVVYTVLLLTCILGFWLFENFYTPDTYSNPNSSAISAPFKKEYLPSSSFNQIVLHDYFMLSYSEFHEQAEWVAYELKKEHLTYDNRKRPYFIEDPKVASKSADWRNYKGSGFDRGHLCPAGDRRFSEYAYNETFYTSNISPQDRAFNAGIWNRLEMQVRDWCKRYDDLYIITGGVLKNNLEEIGSEDVDVPEAFYKVIFRNDNNQLHVMAFLFPNKESRKPLKQFLVTIDELELATGIDFFYKKSDKWQKRIENKMSIKNWKF